MPESPVGKGRKDEQQRGGAADSRRGGGGGGTSGSRRDYEDARREGGPPRPPSRSSYQDVRAAESGRGYGVKDGDRYRDDDRYRDGDRERDGRRDDDYRRPGSSSGRAAGRGGTAAATSRGTPPPKDRERDRDQKCGDRDREEARGTPGSAPRKPPVGNSMMAELLKHSKQMFGGSNSNARGAAEGGPDRRGDGGADSTAAGGSSSPEDGEVRPSPPPQRDDDHPPHRGDGGVGSKRGRQHVPIVWDPQPTKKQATGAAAGGSRGGARADGSSSPLPLPPPPQGLLERAQHEAMMLRQRMAEDDIDPDAPAAMKASPSGSSGHGSADDDEAARNGEGSRGGAGAGGGRTSRAAAAVNNGVDGSSEGAEAQEDSDGPPRKGGIKSKWAMLAAEEDEGTGRGSPAVPGPALGPSEPQALADDDGSDSGSSDDEEGAGQDQEEPAKHRYDMRRECRHVHEFEKICKISEGTYGVVYKAREKSTGRIVALKRVKMEHETDGFPITSVREINILLNFHHPNIVNVEEIVVSPSGPDQIYMVMEYMDHDLKSLMDDKSKFSQPFSAGQAKCLMQQLLLGIDFLHKHWVLHRDLKTSNILYNGKGDLKLCDFGMARQYGSPLGKYTHTVVTLWYRAPELLFGQAEYSTAVDMWSVGCIMGEILTGKALLPGQGEFDQIDKMVQLLGTPTVEEWPGLKDLPNFKKINLKKLPSQLRQRFTAASGFGGSGTTLTEAGFDLLSRLLTWDPDKRITAADALEHRWFKEVPLPVSRVLMPTFAPRKAG